MPKIKTSKTIAKRFKITGSGKVLRGHQAARHKMFSKETRRKRRFKEPIRMSTKYGKLVKAAMGK